MTSCAELLLQQKLFGKIRTGLLASTGPRLTRAQYIALPSSWRRASQFSPLKLPPFRPEVERIEIEFAFFLPLQENANPVRV